MYAFRRLTLCRPVQRVRYCPYNSRNRLADLEHRPPLTGYGSGQIAVGQHHSPSLEGQLCTPLKATGMYVVLP